MYPAHRALGAFRGWFDRMSQAVAPSEEVDGLLRSPEAVRCLTECAPSLGIVLGTRILRRTTFSVPSLGCINLHKGKVPEFRGMPPGFWELYEGASEAGVTVHFVDDGLDTGDVVGTSEIPIHRMETPCSLRKKLDAAATPLLARCVSDLQAGTARTRPQPVSSSKPRTRPTRVQRLELAARAPHLADRDRHLRSIAKSAFHLLLWHSGVHRLFRRRQRRPLGRAAIILHHRVNDVAMDPLTTGVRIFAEHLQLPLDF